MLQAVGVVARNDHRLGGVKAAHRRAFQVSGPRARKKVAVWKVPAPISICLGLQHHAALLSPEASAR